MLLDRLEVSFGFVRKLVLPTTRVFFQNNQNTRVFDLGFGTKYSRNCAEIDQHRKYTLIRSVPSTQGKGEIVVLLYKGKQSLHFCLERIA